MFNIIDVLAPTCVAHYSKDLSTRLVKDPKAKYGVRPFSVREYARLQGVLEDFHFENKRSSYKLISNAVPIQMHRVIFIHLEVLKQSNNRMRISVGSLRKHLCSQL